MAFSFKMVYMPDYQKRYGMCKICRQGIVAGEQIMIGTGYFNGHLIRIHDHFKCWAEEIMRRTNDWFFANEFKPKRMSVEKKAELNRLRAKRYYIKTRGGEPNNVNMKLEAIEEQIALVRVR